MFISHSSKNNAEAVAVRDWLRAEGYAEAFLDLDPEQGLAPGQRWEEELQKAGERCLAVVVLVSPDWCASKWCFHEFKFAKALGKKIFPVLIQPTAWSELPLELTSQFQMANISSPELREDGLTRLRFGLQRAGLDPKHFRLPEGRPPYQGLKALEEEDAAIFFGRDAQITAGLDALRQMRGGTPQRILTIAAASGAGKSSFLKAGLLARLKRDEENFLVLPTWRPSRDALSGETGLANTLGASAPKVAAEALTSRQANVVARFQSMAAAANETWSGAAPTLLLPLDQAEELFSADNASAPAAIELLLDVLASKPDLIVAATIRSDSLGSLQADNRLAAQLRLFNLPALPPSAFREVIEGPARLTDPPITINPALTDRLISDLDKADALPLLAFTLERLVKDYGRDRTLSLQEYETGLGGVSGAINSAVEAALRKAESDPALPLTRYELDSLARAAFIPWLVQLDEADASPKRRVARTADIPEASRRLIGHFIEERLLVASETAGESVVEVSHEAVLRHWRGLAAWISEERIVLEGLGRIIRSAQEWSRQEKTLSYRSADLLVHRGERLGAAEAYLQRKDMAQALRGLPMEYLKACRTAEDEAAARDKAQAERELRQRRRAARWQAMAALILVLGFSALALGGWFLVSEQRAFGKSKSLMLARTAEQFMADGNPRSALLLSILSTRETAMSPSTPEAHASFISAAQTIRQRVAIKHDGPVSGAAFSKDDARILTWSWDNTARLWDTATGAQIGPALKHENDVYGAAFSKDDARILTWSGVHLGIVGDARLWDAATGAQIGPALKHDGPVSGAAFSKDEARILTWSRDGTARLWDAATGAQIGPALKHDGLVYGAAFSKDEARILTWSRDGTARLWDAATGAQIGPALKHDGPVSGAAFSKDDARILTWSEDNTARIWDAATGAQIGPALKHERSVSGAAFSKDEARILTWSWDHLGIAGDARLWDAATGAQIGPALKHENDVYGAAFSSDESRILTWSEDNTARLWDAATGAQIGPALQHKDGVKGAVFSDDEARILTWGRDGTARLWDAATGVQIGPALQHEDGVTGAAFSDDEARILTWSRDGTARLWDSATSAQIGPAVQHDGSVFGAAFSNDEARILTWSGDNTARLWDAATGAQIGPALQHKDGVKGAAFSKDEARILTWSGNPLGTAGDARLWDAATGAQIGPALQHDGSISGATFSNDETRILTWNGVLLGTAGDARIWDAATGAQIGPALKHDGPVSGAAFSKDDARILTWSRDGTARLWDAATGAQIGPALQHKDGVKGAAFSKDEARILTWSGVHLGIAGDARLWDAATGAQIGPTLQHDGLVYGAAFSNDEARILTWSWDRPGTAGDARIWDAATGAQIGPALKHDGPVSGAAFSKDDARILTWSEDNTARIWDAATGAQIGPALKHERSVSGAAFSKDEARILTWSWDNTARLWDTATGAQIGPALQHEDLVTGAAFSDDEARILTWSWDNTARLWDVKWAKKLRAMPEDVAQLCDLRLRGSLANADNDAKSPFPRLLDEQIVAAAPMLRGRVGEDVCAAPKLPWWDAPLQSLMKLTGIE
ncbi:TIR domain-containing protein [Hyphomonas sp.]|uniref:nSTAND1 domain-containing NTPase n=1 Tax=Hyphomonas sp. TaxID=87 RepID=UPI0026094DA9|nr:TIR domain-containing protein [Hyphomonas sp.]